jgi:hypothetical protein
LFSFSAIHKATVVIGQLKIMIFEEAGHEDGELAHAGVPPWLPPNPEFPAGSTTKSKNGPEMRHKIPF